MPRLAEALDDMLARHARAFGALGDPAHASSLESALVRAGRLEEAFLLRWRRGEPSLAATAVAEAQRSALAALDADPPLQVVPCEVCGPFGCGHTNPFEVANGASRDALRWTPLGAGFALPEVPVVGARGVRRPEELVAVSSLGTVVVLEVSSTALRPEAELPSTTESLTVFQGGEEEGQLEPDQLAGLGRLRALDLFGRLTDERLEALLESCDGRLERLRVDASLLTDNGLEALVHAPRLRELSFGDAPWLDGSCLRALVDVGAPLERFSLRAAPRSTWRMLDAVASLETVEEVELSRVVLDDDDGLGALAALPRLRRLSVANGEVGPGAFDDLADTPVERVELARIRGLDDAALDALAASATLRELSAREVPGPTRGWAALGRAPRLERLTLSTCSVDDAALLAIASSTSLVELSLGGISSVSAGEGLAALGRMARLERLCLSGADLTPVVLEAFASAGAGVSTLVLGFQRSAATLELLASAARLPRLEDLVLASALEPGALAGLAGALELRELTLSSAMTVDDAELAALRACLPLRSLRLRCDQWTRLRLAEALPGVEVLPLNPSARSPIAES